MQVLKIVTMTDYEERDVDTLSGGQQQRVAIARAIVNEPEVLLLDEPLAALDLKMRKDMQMEIKAMHKKLGISFVYVTHDQEEALTLSDTNCGDAGRHNTADRHTRPRYIMNRKIHLWPILLVRAIFLTE